MNYYNEIKNELINNEVYKNVKDYSKNKNDLNTYYNVGKLLVEAGNQYGESIIKNYSKRLTKELDKKYGIRNLYNMRLFYLPIDNNQNLQTVSANLTWSHYVELLNSKNVNEINYYIKITIDNNLSVREL